MSLSMKYDAMFLRPSRNLENFTTLSMEKLAGEGYDH